MAFRFEQKIIISGSNAFLFKSWLINSGGTRIHNDRTVTSIYFDNSALDLYTLSNEGSVPRKKIRLRCYDELNKIGELNRYEIKISAAEGRYKEISKIENSNSILKYGILDKDYGICKPVVLVSTELVKNCAAPRLFSSRISPNSAPTEAVNDSDNTMRSSILIW